MHKARATSHGPDCLPFCLPSDESLIECDIQCGITQEFPTLASLGNLQGAADQAMPGPHRTQTSLHQGGGVWHQDVCVPQVTVMYGQSWVPQVQTVTFSRSERTDERCACPGTGFGICSLTASTDKPQMDIEPESRASVSLT